VVDKNLVILYGGHPDESAISKQSALNIFKASIENGLEPILININKVELKPLLESIFNPVIINMVHGRWGEDGGAQSLFDELDIPYFGSGMYASEVTFDKNKFRNCVEEVVRMPFGKFMTKEEYLADWTKNPHIIKPHDSGSSAGVRYMETKDKKPNWIDRMIVEEFVDGVEGATVVYKGKCIGGVIVNYKGKIFDYDTKYDPKLSRVEDWDSLDQDIRNEVAEFSKAIYNECRCKGFLVVDFRVSTKGVPYILEANTLPGMTQCSLVPYVFKKNGTNFNELVKIMINDASMDEYHATDTNPESEVETLHDMNM
jgi:D-alanine-D-alanine ligase